MITLPNVSESRTFVASSGRAAYEKVVAARRSVGAAWAGRRPYGSLAEGFRLDGRTYPYFASAYNDTWLTERIVEVPVALGVLDAAGPEARTLELGNVLSHYGRRATEVVDRYEEAERVHNVDIVDYAPGDGFDAIVSISTLEHVGFDEDVEELDKPLGAIAHLERLLRPGGRLLVTWSVNYNQHLDRRVFAGEAGFDQVSYLRRVDRWNRWEQISAEAAVKARYGVPFQNANVVAFGTAGAA